MQGQREETTKRKEEMGKGTGSDGGCTILPSKLTIR